MVFVLHTSAERSLILRLYLNTISTVQPAIIYKKQNIVASVLPQLHENIFNTYSYFFSLR